MCLKQELAWAINGFELSYVKQLYHKETKIPIFVTGFEKTRLPRTITNI